MFIEVRYGHNETLICNPYCIVVNLLKNIKERTGFNNRHMTLDLSDQTGLVKDLDLHHLDKADKFLTNQGPYILVEKQLVVQPEDLTDSRPDSTSTVTTTATVKEPLYNFIPLLDDCEDLFPEYKVRVAHVIEKKLKKPRHQSPIAKSPSPAGRKQKKKSSKKK